MNKQQLEQDLLETEIELRREKIAWRKYGKGINGDNIRTLRKRVEMLKGKLKEYDKEGD